jgi:hypothetical protein
MISDNQRAIYRLLRVAGFLWGQPGEAVSGYQTRAPAVSLQPPQDPMGSGDSPRKIPLRRITGLGQSRRALSPHEMKSQQTNQRAPLILALLLLSTQALPVLSQAGMVDTVQYGQIQLGMKEKEILERLGPPDRIQEKEKRSARNTSPKKPSRLVRSKRLIYTGTNPASGQKITTTIILENGKVVDKRRSYD